MGVGIVVEVARATGLNVEAQNVNDEPALQRRREAGCKPVQGSLVGRLRSSAAETPPQSSLRSSSPAGPMGRDLEVSR